jgi:capsular exopolysaccharide synthesis family protein
LICDIVTEANMDAIQTYRGYPAPAAPGPLRAAPVPLAANPAAVKTPSDYLRALRRRIWMVLAVGVPLAVLSCIFVLRLKPVYLVKAEIEINAPDYDPALSTLVSHEIGRRDPGSQAQYIPNRAAQLKSARLQQKVVSRSELSDQVSQFEDPAAELLSSLNVIPLQRNGNTFIVTLEGRDAFRTRRLMEVLLREFAKEAKDESQTKIAESEDLAKGNLTKLEGELKELETQISAKLATSTTLGAGGKSLIEERVINLAAMLNQKQMRLGELNQQMLIMQHFPKMDQSPETARRASLLDHLEEQRHRYQEYLEYTVRAARHPNTDGAARAAARKLEAVMDEIEELKNIRTEIGLTPTEMILDQYQREIEADKAEHAQLLREMRDSLPKHQEVLDMIEDRKDKAKRIADMKVRLAEFQILANSPSVTEFVKVPSSVLEPMVPVRPNRVMLIVASLFLSAAAGIGLVCLLEHVDHAVKVPEHVSHGLTLPMLGVVPRIRRTALTQRGSHLWTPGSTDALASDSYRNVRASLLGVTDRRGPIVTLLVTSAKAGEGKSTTALNLAATCALAGERTLLVDVDLRRPSLSDVFIEDEDLHSILGIVDALKGDAPWQRTLRHTRIPNLDFMPTGDTRDTPIEVLGTLELRQLLLALSHHYDRVILDGPAVLGLADCRFLGRIVDSSLLVVRSGTHHLTTLHRAKAMLEQSHVDIAGVVVNGLTEDMENWSSYYGYNGVLPPPKRAETPATEDGALALAGGLE